MDVLCMADSFYLEHRMEGITLTYRSRCLQVLPTGADSHCHCHQGLGWPTKQHFKKLVYFSSISPMPIVKLRLQTVDQIM